MRSTYVYIKKISNPFLTNIRNAPCLFFGGEEHFDLLNIGKEISIRVCRAILTFLYFVFEHTCSGDSGASCDNTNLGCSDVLSKYPSNCNCQDSSNICL